MPPPGPSATAVAATIAPTFNATCTRLGGVSTFPKQPQDPMGMCRTSATTTNAVKTRYDRATSAAATGPPVTIAATPTTTSTAPPMRTTTGGHGEPCAPQRAGRGGGVVRLQRARDGEQQRRDEERTGPSTHLRQT